MAPWKKSAAKQKSAKRRARRRSVGRSGSPRKATRSISKAASSTNAAPRRIALSLKRSAEHSKRWKAPAYRSAMSMLVFYINRAGKALPAARKRVLEQAKQEQRKQFARVR